MGDIVASMKESGDMCEFPIQTTDIPIKTANFPFKRLVLCRWLDAYHMDDTAEIGENEQSGKAS